ncbi:uncharacterized protein LOC143356080 [Halictus rubicundus]|uniref:uncharacterized protein LOC143356080 n=1 Tax=Halictus rubicundus TaxID=77578 RepID=UPI0040356EB1
MEIETPYLDAIQSIPGETIGEKYQWIAKLIQDRASECNSLEEIIEDPKVPRVLAPLIQVHAAHMLNKRDPTNENNYKAIAEALKSDNVEVVTKALQVKSFFDGSNKTFTNVEYFLNQLLPLVSLNTRTRIIKNLSICLKDTALAEEFFTAIAVSYGLKQALPLLPACSESFMFDTVVNKNIVLSRKLVKTIFRKYPDFIVRYFRLSKSSNDPNDRNLHKVDIRYMSDFLAALVKKRLSSFVELFEMHENMYVKLSKKQAVCFLKNGKDHLLKKPKLFIKLVPLQMISVSRMEVMFPKLFPEKLANFDTDTMLNYLTYYPEEKKADLLIKSYRDVYGKNILDESRSVTANLMCLLSAEERIRQARIKIEKEIGLQNYGVEDYRHTWRCYLPTNEAIPKIKEEIAKSPELERRAALVSQMIYSCRVNCDDQALLEVLTYVRDRHKNENSMFLLRVLEDLMKLYNLPRVNKDVWAVLMDIILRAHVKDDLRVSSCTSIKIIEAALHFRIINEQPIDKEIDILVDLKSKKYEVWNVLKKYPEYERRCLEACITVFSQRFSSNTRSYPADKDGTLRDLVTSIYDFNTTHVKKNTRVEPMSIKNYPWLVKEIERIVQTNDVHNSYVIESLKSILRTNEKVLGERLFGKEAPEDLELFALLKTNPKLVLSMWKECLKAFAKHYYYSRSAIKFMRTARWYNEIPVKFLQQSLQDMSSQKGNACLASIALLVHGHTLVKILEPLMPTNQMLDIHHEKAKNNYNDIFGAINCAIYSNPPIPFSLLCRYCEGDFFSMGLMAMVNLCRRSLLPYVLSYARTLATQRVSVRKHGVRVMHLVAPRDQLHQFLLSEWKTEEHYSIREVLFSTARKLFCEEPGPTTWSLISQMVCALDKNNTSAISDAIRMIPSVSDKYVADFVKMILDVVDKLPEESGDWLSTSLISAISPSVCNLLPEELNELILRRFLLVQSMNSAGAATSFAQTSYLMAAGDKFESRMKTFTDVFVEAVRSRWNVPHPKKPHFLTTNYGLRLFIKRLVFDLDGSDQLRVLDGILNAFLKALTPQMDPTTYLMLFFRREQLAANTPKDFGLNLGRKLQELLSTFSPLFIGFMADVLKSLLSQRDFAPYDRDYSRLEVIEGLVEIGTAEATVIAAGLMTPVVEKQYVQRYDDLMTKFLQHEHPAVKSIACDHVNQANNSNFYFENE